MSYQPHNFQPGAVLLAEQLNEMDNEIARISGGEGALSENVKQSLLECFENVAWINENGQTYYDALYDSLYPDNMWFITNILNGCVTSNNATSILKNNSYVATITANEGYTLDGATVSITIGGNDVTNLYYSSGSINIPNVTGDLVITVTAASDVVSISAVFTQVQDTPITIGTTRINAYISADGRWVASNDLYSVCVPVTQGKRYKFQFSSTSSTDVGTIFRYGFSDTNTPTGQTLTGWIRSTPQDYIANKITASGSYLVIQLDSSSASSVISNEYLTLTELGSIIYDTDNLDIIRQYLVVTAVYSDSTTDVVTDYTLSGTLSVGTSTITASYGGKTDTFSVTVTATPFEYGVYTPDSVITGGYIDNTGTFVPSGISSGYFEDYIPVVRSSYLICYNNAPFTANSSDANWRVSEYDMNMEFIKQTQFARVVDGVAVDTQFASRIVTFDSATRFIRLGWYDVKNSAIAVFEIENPESVVNMLMESGDINFTTGVDTTENKRIRTDGYIPASGTITVTGCPFSSSWSAWSQHSTYGVRCYDSDHLFVGTVSEIPNSPATNVADVALPANTAYIRFIMQYGKVPFTNFKWLVNHLFTVNGNKYYIVGE